jgi:ABC-type branched-subunit amino acid transport system substrate-binding protein
MKPSWRWHVAMPITALALVAAACGSDDDGGASTEAPATEAPATEAPATEAPATEAPATEAPATEAPAAAAFQVPTENCPPEATTALADGEPIKLAFIGPQTGPLAAFGVIAQGMNVYFDKLNEAGGVEGHQVEVITKDDAYDPAKSAPAVQEAIEGDQVFASVFQIGTPNVAGTRQLYADACVPQALVGTGFPNWGDPANFPWTLGGIPSYTVEANVWTEFIKEKFPDATKVALLTFNNDFGKTYKEALNELLPAAGLEIVADVVHEPTSDLSNEVTQLLAAGPDIIIGGTTSTFCTSLMTLARQGGFTGPIINSYTCQAIEQFMVPAGEAAANVHTLVLLKDPADPAYAEDPEVQQYLADVEQFAPDVDPTIGNVATGYNAGAVITDALTRAAAMEGGLTRANLMNAFWSLDLEPPLVLGGRAKVDGVSDAYISEYGVMAEYDPAATGYKTSEGVEIDVEGQGGVFEG